MVALALALAPSASARPTALRAVGAQSIAVRGYDGGVALAPAAATASLASTTFRPDADYNIPSTQAQQLAAQQKAASNAADAIDKVSDGVMTLGGAIMAYGLATGPGEAIAAPVGLGIVAFGAGLKIGAAVGKYVWGDPYRDRRFKLIAKPLPVRIPKLTASGAPAVDQAAGRYLTASLKLVEIGQAYQTSLNRAIGAHDGHSEQWTVRQLNAAAKYAKQGANLFLSLRGLREQFVAATAASGVSTVTLPTTTATERRHALKVYTDQLPKAVFKLFKDKPLRGRSLYSLLSSSAGDNATGTFALSSVFESSALDRAEDTLAGHLRTFALIVKRVKPGHLPAGL
jgi:hypothetical protein